MNDTNLQCLLDDTSELRKLILENPEAPILVFVGDEANTGDYSFVSAKITKVDVKELTLYGDQWLDYDELEDEITDDLYDEEDYKYLSNEEFKKTVEKKASEEEFIRVITIYVE